MMAITSIKFKNERTKTNFCGEDMSLMKYSNVNHTIHADSIANHGIALSSWISSFVHIGFIVVVALVELFP